MVQSHVLQFINARVFTATTYFEPGSVVVENGTILYVGDYVPYPNAEVIDCKKQWLIAGCIDVQKYGGHGFLFAQQPSEAALQALVNENAAGGVIQCMVTIPTQPLPIYYQSIDAIKSYWANGGKGILGLHLEGPFINPAKRGAHILEWIQVPTVAMVKELLDYGKDVLKIVTLAPECCDAAVIKLFVDARVKVSAGHSNATYEQAMGFAGNGISMATHLFNAMSPLYHRDVGLPGAALLNPNLSASIIPDGIHVSYATLQLAKKMMGNRLFYITDAVTPTSEGAYPHVFTGDRYTMPDGTLSGSAISMLDGIRNGIKHAGIDTIESIKMANLYPAQVLGIDDKYGSIAVGKAPGLVLVDDQWNGRIIS